MDDGRVGYVLLLLPLHFLLLLFPGEAQFPGGGGGFMPPMPNGGGGFMPPMANGEFPSVNCSELVCGKGNCNSTSSSTRSGSSYSYSYSYNYSGSLCSCQPGWKQPEMDVSQLPFDYRPCVLPNCTLQTEGCNYTPSPPAPPRLADISNPCNWIDCGMGNCEPLQGSFLYRCSCRPGFANLFNDSAYPCMSECVIASDHCKATGVSLSAKSTDDGGNGPEAKNRPTTERNKGDASHLGKPIALLLLTIVMCLV